jgi:uncharacterized membrane protein
VAWPSSETLNRIKLILEVLLLGLFLLLLIHIARKDGRHAALSLLTNKP